MVTLARTNSATTPGWSQRLSVLSGGTLNLHVRDSKKYIYVSFSEKFKLLNPDAQNRQK